MKAKSKIAKLSTPASSEVRWLTTGDCAKKLGVTSRLVARWIDSGRLLGFCLPGCKDRRVHPDALAEFERREGFCRARGEK